MAVKAALFNTKIPRVSAAVLDGGTVDLQLSDDIYDCDRLTVQTMPLLVTLCKIGDFFIVDPSAEEEECSVTSLVVGIACKDNKGIVTTTRMCGSGSLRLDTMIENLELSISAAICLNRELMKQLEADEGNDENEEKMGFLVK